jgi:hypothetical protein
VTSVTRPAGEPRPLRGWLVALGLVLTLGPWALAVPLFGGYDEIDHVFRASSAADGEILPSGRVLDGQRGEVVHVRADVYQAAASYCERQGLAGQHGCPAPLSGNVGTEKRVETVTAAARYQPLYYVVIGQVSRVASGPAVDALMRLLAAALVGVLLAWSFAVVRLWARTPWPYLGLLAALTPMFQFSGVLPAPNGLEMAAQLSLWAAAAGLVGCADPRVRLRLMMSMVPGAVVLVTLRSIGPVWLALWVMVVGLVLLGARRVLQLGREGGRAVRRGLVLVTAAAVLGAAWTISQRTNALETVAGTHPLSPSVFVRGVAEWVLGAVAAIPHTTSFGKAAFEPPWMYPAALVGVTALVVGGFAVADRRGRLAMVSVLLVSLMVPLLLTVVSYSRSGPVWQGRYGIGFFAGVLMIAAQALDQREVPCRRLTLSLLWGSFAGTSVLCLGWVALTQERFGLTHPWSPGPWLLVVLMALGQAAWLTLLLGRTTDEALGLRPDDVEDLLVDPLQVR